MIDPIVIDPKKASKEDIARALELLAKEETRKARIQAGELKGGQKWSELSPEQKKARQMSSKLRERRRTLIFEKASKPTVCPHCQGIIPPVEITAEELAAVKA